MQLRSTFGIGARTGVKMLVYGKSGRGKTTLCATAPTPVILSAEAGLLSLSQFQLPYVEIKDMAGLQEAYRWALGSAEARQFETICLDSLTEIAEVVLNAAKKSVKDPRQAYGEMIEKMTDIIRLFRDLPGRNVYMSAKQEYAKNEITGVMINSPMMPGAKLGQQLPYFFDEVFQLDIGSTPEGVSYRFLRTQPDFMNDAKDRSGRLDPVEEPNLGKVISKINLAT